jgi:hypothetical protein
MPAMQKLNEKQEPLTDVLTRVDEAIEREDLDNLATEYKDMMQKAESMANTIMRAATQTNRDRLQIGTDLLNLFNHAIFIQAHRNQWTVDDYKAFVISLTALDSIGISELARVESERLEGDIVSEFARKSR